LAIIFQNYRNKKKYEVAITHVKLSRVIATSFSSLFPIFLFILAQIFFN